MFLCSFQVKSTKSVGIWLLTVPLAYVAPVCAAGLQLRWHVVLAVASPAQSAAYAGMHQSERDGNRTNAKIYHASNHY